MKTNKIIVVIALAMIIGFSLIIFYQDYTIKKLEKTNQLQAVELSMANDTVKKFRNKADELISQIKVVEVSRDNLKESLEKAGVDIEKLRDDKIRLNKVIEYYKMQGQATGTGSIALRDTFTIIKRDTINYLKFDKWSNDFLIMTNGEIINRQLNFNYRYLIDFQFFKEEYRKSTIISVKFKDPGAEITSANSIVVFNEKKWWEKPWLWGLAGLTTGILISK